MRRSTLQPCAWFLPSLALSILLSSPLVAATTYQVPSQPLVDIVDAPLTPAARLGPDGEWLLLLDERGWTSIAELAQRELRLAGLRIRPQTNGPSRARTWSGIALLRIADGEVLQVLGLPENPRLDHAQWSPDGRHVVFTLTTDDDDRTELWVLEVATARARRLTPEPLNLAADEGPRWLPSSDGVLCLLVPEGRGPEPEPRRVPAGPVVEESSGVEAPARTYQDLLTDPYDEALFEHYFTARLARVGLDGSVTRLGEAGLVWDFAPSPSGEYVLLETLHRPFSYRVPASRFPRRVEVLDRAGHPVHLLADLPLQEEIPMAFGSVATGPREVEWRADAPHTLAWVEALDGGDARVEAAERDRVLLLDAPFTAEPRRLATLALRYAEIAWGNDGLALVSSFWMKTRQTRTWWVAPGDPGSEARLLFDRSFEDRYSDPGSPATRPNAAGLEVLHTGADGRTLFLVGDGASPEGDRPFLDVLHLQSGESERRFRSTAPWLERPLSLLDPAGERILVRRESPTEPPNYLVRTVANGELRELTHFPHPTPALRDIHKELVRYRREDGVELTATLYTPPGYAPERDGPLPLLMWAYPREFKSADAASQVRDSPYQFDRLTGWSPLVWLAVGYAVLDDPAMPIVGEGDAEPNDTYVKQLVASARAAVDEVVRRGVADRRRIAVGGHSYGAFMTANLLSWSDLFAAGIARSGAYNRTLTPFGFQAEERSLWQAPEVYFRMSPFMHAEDVHAPLLLIHGEADNNSGTFPLQSRRYFAALKGNGAVSRLVMLPAESHGYRARESILHMLWETERWLDRYVRNAPVTGETTGASP